MKIVLSLWLVILLAGCAPTLTPSPSPTGRGESTPTPAATWTPVPATATATATPMPKLTMEDLKSMSVEDKLKMAPQAESAPDSVVSSFAAGEGAKDIAWSGKSLTFWDRVVAYEGTTKSGEKVTMYFDLESGQWAKQYEDFDEVSKIPADEVADVMVVNDENGAHLVRNKLQYDYDWISQPQVMIEGKMVFRDEKGYPKAVFDTNTGKWMTPEEAKVVITLDDFKEAAERAGTYVGDNGKTYNYDIIFDERFFELLTDPAQINKLENGDWITIFNPSGEYTYWAGKKEAADRAREGATIVVGRGSTIEERYQNLYGSDIRAMEIFFKEYQRGNKTFFVTYGDVGVRRSEIKGAYSPRIDVSIDEIPKIMIDGKIASPVVRMPELFISGFSSPDTVTMMLRNNQLTNLDFWLDEIINAGANFIFIYNNQEDIIRNFGE